MIYISLSEYCRQALSGNFTFPHFHDACPICGQADCAVKNGFYYRKHGSIPVQTYKCRNPAPGKHRTFSLLPWPLIPYRKHTVTELFTIVNIASTSETCLKACLEIEERLNIPCTFSGSLRSYLKLQEQAERKWGIFRQRKKYSTRLDTIPREELPLWAYLYHLDRRDFLYGVPSHKRQRKGYQSRAP